MPYPNSNQDHHMVHYSLPLNASSLEEKFEKHINSQQLKEVGDYKEKINNFF
jgi:hypothetical protein